MNHKEKTYQVICTKSYLDVGLMIEQDDKLEPKRVLARSRTYSSDSEYGICKGLTWVKTGVFLSKDEWIGISHNKPTDQILDELGIKKTVDKEEVTEDVQNINQIDSVNTSGNISKAILVIDMPNSCNDCMIMFEDDYSKWCPWAYSPTNVYDYAHNESKPDWCPLRPMPNKIPITDFDSNIKAKNDNAFEVGAYMYDRGHYRGYNICIDKILKL